MKLTLESFIGIIIVLILIIPTYSFASSLFSSFFGGSNNEKENVFFFDSALSKEISKKSVEELSKYDKIIEDSLDKKDDFVSKEFIKGFILAYNSKLNENYKEGDKVGLFPLSFEIASRYKLKKEPKDERLDSNKSIEAGISYLFDVYKKVHNSKREKDDVVYLIIAYEIGLDNLMANCPLILNEGFTSSSCTNPEVLKNIKLSEVIGYSKYFDILA